MTIVCKPLAVLPIRTTCVQRVICSVKLFTRIGIPAKGKTPASTQKPQMVIDGVSDFLAHDYANIHRGLYDLSERSESLYDQSKHLVAELLNTSSKEVIYTYNATYAINLVAQSLVNSHFLQKGDKILVSIWDHHANSLPRLALGKLFGIQVEFF